MTWSKEPIPFGVPVEAAFLTGNGIANRAVVVRKPRQWMTTGFPLSFLIFQSWEIVWRPIEQAD